MTRIDEFATTLLEEAKHFFEKAQTEKTDEAKDAYLHAALNVAFCALEAHVNAVAEDFLVRTDLTVLDRAILSEREFRLEDGEYRLSNQLRMFRLEDRIQFLQRRFSNSPLDTTMPSWSVLKQGLFLRNGLTHPKDFNLITESDVERTLLAIIDVLDSLYQALYQTGYPAARRRLESRMDF